MKKNCFSYLLFGCLLLLSGCRLQSDTKFLTIPQNHNIMSNQFQIIAYVNKNDSPYFNLDNITRTSLYNKLTKDLYSVKVKKINNTKKVITYQKEDYYEYYLDVFFDFECSEIIKIPEALLLIEYINDDQLTLNLGDVAIARVESDYDLSIRHLMGIVSSSSEEKTLNGIAMRIENVSDLSLTISQIETVNSICDVDEANIFILETMPQDYYQSIEELSIEAEKIDLKTNPITILPHSEIIILLPLKYSYAKQVNQTGLIITYVHSEFKGYKVIDNFKFFNNYYINNLEVKYVSN